MCSARAVPTTLPPEAAEKWLDGAGWTDVRSGDLWTLAWDGELLGHLVVASVHSGFVLGWPVTLPGEASFKPGMLAESPLGVQVTLWPTRETGIGFHLLDRCLGRMLSAVEVHRISAALDADHDPGFRWAEGSATDPFNDELDHHQIARWAELCFHTGQSEHPRWFVDERRAKLVGGSARALGQALGLDPPEARTFWKGEQALTEAQGSILSDVWNAQLAEFCGPDPTHALWQQLAHPDFKATVGMVTAKYALTESTVRTDAARSAFALAARDDSLTRARQKLMDALHRIGSEEGCAD